MKYGMSLFLFADIAISIYSAEQAASSALAVTCSGRLIGKLQCIACCIILQRMRVIPFLMQHYIAAYAGYSMCWNAAL